MSLKDVIYRFRGYYKDYKWQFAIAILGMIFASIGTSASAYVVKPVLDDIFFNKDKNMLYVLPYAVVGLYFLKGLGTFLQAYYTAYIGQDVVRRFRQKLLKNLLNQDLAFFHEFRTGELISRNINDIDRIRSVVSSMIPQMARDTLTCIGLLAVVIYQSPQLALFSIVFFPLAIYPLSRLAKKMKKTSRQSQEKNSDITACLSEIFTNIEVIKACNCEGFEAQKFKKENEKYFNICLKSTKISEIVSPMMETIGSVAIAVVIIVGGAKVIDGEISAGTFFSFMTALFMLYTPLKSLSNSYNKLQDAVVASERTFELMDKRPFIVGGLDKFPNPVNIITLQDVWLKYGDKTALQGINFSVKRGQMLALVGNSGGGKSSIINLLMRFYDANSGNILINDLDITKFSLNSLRQNIGLVSQRIFIFNDSIAKNVSYGEEFDEQRVINALKMANAYEFVSELNGGIYATLNEFGANLSGGQRQRIAIARAIYKNPQVIIFDEATSALDNESERLITQSIENIRKDKILIVIAHRLSTVENADSIAVIQHGKVVDFGNDEELSKTSAVYNRLKGVFEQ